MCLTSRGGRRVSASSDKLRESAWGEGGKLRRQMPKAPEGVNSFGEAVGGEGSLIQPSSSLPEIIVLYYLADCELNFDSNFCTVSTRLGL